MARISHSIIELVDTRLREFGMEILGVFLHAKGEPGLSDKNGKQMFGLMIASPGRTMWRFFRASSQYLDGEPDPMNRWSAHLLQNIAGDFGGHLSMPFDRPFPPFQRWAMRAARLRQSPLGLLIHPDYGLWFALCGVLFFEFNTGDEEIQNLVHDENCSPDICEECSEKPCLSACPADAFGDWGFDAHACHAHLDIIMQSVFDPDCMKIGCAARGACPVGVEHQYGEEQLQFHMAAFA